VLDVSLIKMEFMAVSLRISLFSCVYERCKLILSTFWQCFFYCAYMLVSVCARKKRLVSKKFERRLIKKLMKKHRRQDLTKNQPSSMLCCH